MSFFSPITERSPGVKGFFLAVYVLLILGAVTMIVPFLVMVTGSMSGTFDGGGFSLYPKLLVSKVHLWRRYLESKYQGNPELIQIAWGDPSATFRTVPLPTAAPESPLVPLWRRFLEEVNPDVSGFMLAFTRPDSRETAYHNRGFQLWLLKQYNGDFSQLNKSMGTQFAGPQSILPLPTSFIGGVQFDRPLVRRLKEYSSLQAADSKVALNVGNYFRTVYLPRKFGDIKSYNAEMGTNYGGFADIPFSQQVPSQESTHWIAFVQKALRPQSVSLSEEGKISFENAKVPEPEYLRSMARPEELRVSSADVLFEKWAAAQGVPNARIPQRELDYAAFNKEKTFWTWQFIAQNYVYVLDGIVTQGRPMMNTCILVILMVGGTLIINPLAAYALSRYKPRQSYQILLFLLATIAFPAEVTMIPSFLQLKAFGLLNTFGALVLPALVNGFSIFLLKGFFDSLPKELYEAADIDGASEWQIFWGITMNLSKPILAVIALGAFTAAYSAFFFALILAPEEKMWTLMVWIYQISQVSGPGIVYASLLITAIPTLLVFLGCQNLILRGIVVPTEK